MNFQMSRKVERGARCIVRRVCVLYIMVSRLIRKLSMFNYFLSKK